MIKNYPFFKSTVIDKSLSACKKNSAASLYLSSVPHIYMLLFPKCAAKNTCTMAKTLKCTHIVDQQDNRQGHNSSSTCDVHSELRSPLAAASRRLWDLFMNKDFPGVMRGPQTATKNHFPIKAFSTKHLRNILLVTSSSFSIIKY